MDGYRRITKPISTIQPEKVAETLKRKTVFITFFPLLIVKLRVVYTLLLNSKLIMKELKRNKKRNKKACKCRNDVVVLTSENPMYPRKNTIRIRTGFSTSSLSH